MAEAQAQPAPAEQVSAAGRLVGILIEPGRTFRAIAHSPGWIVPILLTVIIVLVAFNVVIGRMGGLEVVIKAQFESNPDRLERMRQAGEDPDEIAEQTAKGPMGLATKYVFPVLGTVLGVLILAGLSQFLLSMLGGAPIFSRVLSVVAHSWFAYQLVVSTLTIVVVYLMANPESLDLYNPVYSNPSFLVPKERDVLRALLGCIDAFSFWQIWLLSLGLSIVTPNVSRGRALALIIALWGVYVLGKVGMAAVF